MAEIPALIAVVSAVLLVCVVVALVVFLDVEDKSKKRGDLLPPNLIQFVDNYLSTEPIITSILPNIAIISATLTPLSR